MKEINIAQSILSKRKEKGLTQDELADYIGVSKASVSKWETGQSYPDITLLPRLATYFDMSIDKLMGYTPQISKEDIRALYMKFSADFSEKPFEEVMDEVNMTIKKYYSCYPFLLQMATLFLNHFMFAKDNETMNSILESCIDICKRIKNESDDIYLAQEANSVEAICNITLSRPIEVIDLLQDVTLHNINQNEMVLAIAYEMKGDFEASKRTLQITSYQYVIYLVGAAVVSLKLYKNDRVKFEEILRRSLIIADAYNLDKLHPNATIQLLLTAAICFTEMSDYERALEFLRKGVDAYENFKFPAMLQGDDYFDMLGDWIEDFELGGNAPIDASLFKKSFLEMLKNPAFAPLFDNSEYKNIVTRAEDI